MKSAIFLFYSYKFKHKQNCGVHFCLAGFLFWFVFFCSKFRQSTIGDLTYPTSFSFSDEIEPHTSTTNKNTQKL